MDLDILTTTAIRFISLALGTLVFCLQDLVAYLCLTICTVWTMSQVVAAFAQLGDLQERSDRQQALATKAVEVDKSPGFVQGECCLTLRLPQFIVAFYSSSSSSSSASYSVTV